MDLQNDIFRFDNTKIELVEKLNSEEIYEKINFNFKQKHKIKNLTQQLIKHNYIINDISNNRKKNLLKEIKTKSYFNIIIKKVNLPLLIFPIKELIIFMIIINSFIPIFTSKSHGMREYSLLNEITIKIIGIDTQNILNENYKYPPDKIYIQDNSYTIDEKNRIIGLVNNENNITMKWNNKLTYCIRMFSGLSNMVGIDLTDFDLSQITVMNFMFENCYNLQYIKFNNNNQSNLSLKDISNMFLNCISLKTLDLSNLDISHVTNVMNLFLNCSSLISLNLDGFNTSSVTAFMGMFYNCYSLLSLELSSFDTSNALLMNSMFYNCSSLTSLDLYNFNTSKVQSMAGMFFECSNLISLDLSNFDTSQVLFMNNLFHNCTRLISLDLSNFNTSNIESMTDIFINCNNLQFINFSNYIGINDLNESFLFKSIPENITYCFKGENEIPKFIQQLKDKKCSINDCSDNWKIKEKKIIIEKDMCVYNCSEDNEYKYEFKNKCYNNCPEGTYLSSDNNKCIIICGEYLPFEMNEECISNCSTQDFFNNIYRINNQNINTKEFMINTIINEISDGSVDLLISKVLKEDKEDYFIKNNNTEIFHITSSYNQKNNEYNNVSRIDIGECEDKLKEIYKINNNETLLIFKTDFSIENYSIPIIEYEIFDPQKKTKLDLNYCNEIKIKVYSPVATIDEGYLYKYNPNSDYYKDKCYPFTSEHQNVETMIY